MTGSFGTRRREARRRSVPPRGRHARRRIGRRLPRRPPLRDVAAARAGRARAVPRRPPRRASRSARRSRRATSRSGSPAPRADQGGAPRPAHRRRRREHLRGRGALARAHPPAARGRQPRRRRGAALHRGCPPRARARDRATGLDAARLPPAGRRAGAGCSTSSRSTAERASRASAAGRRSRRSASPAAAPGTARVPASRLAAARRAARRAGPRGRGAQLRVAADRARRRSRICGTVQPPVRSSSFARNAGSSSRCDLLVRRPLRVEQRLRPHAVAAPARRVHLDPGHPASTEKPPKGSRAGRSLDWAAWRPDVQDRGRRPALAAVLRGRPDPPPLHARTRPGRRGREGRPQDEVAVRRAARAALARRAACCTRARASCTR